jgi:hypothetical protein
LAHAFFAERLVLRGDLAKYDKTKARRFRYWLFKAAHHFFLNHLAYERRAMRDGRLTVEYDPELHDVGGQSEPEQAASRQDAHRLVSDIVSELRVEYCASSSSDEDAALRNFEALKPFLVTKMTGGTVCRDRPGPRHRAEHGQGAALAPPTQVREAVSELRHRAVRLR